jgi:adenosylcobyric acid synthase
MATTDRGLRPQQVSGRSRALAPAPDDLETATGVPTIGVLPWIDHGLPDEEGPTVLARSGHGPRVSVVCGPYASNLDEFVQLQQVARVNWVRTAAQLADADLIVLPGSKHVANDLAWLRDAGLADAVSQAAGNGIAVLGICGGLQMLGQRIEDPDRVEGAAEGLGLLPMVTHYETSKRTTQNTVCFGPLAPPWSWLGECRISGYEIRHGVTQAPQDIQIVPDGRAFGRGNVLGLYVHGVFEDPVALTAFAGAVSTTLDTTCDQLADAVESHLDTAWLLKRLEQADKPIGG